MERWLFQKMWLICVPGQEERDKRRETKSEFCYWILTTVVVINLSLCSSPRPYFFSLCAGRLWSEMAKGQLPPSTTTVKTMYYFDQLLSRDEWLQCYVNSTLYRKSLFSWYTCKKVEGNPFILIDPSHTVICCNPFSLVKRYVLNKMISCGHFRNTVYLTYEVVPSPKVI